MWYAEVPEEVRVERLVARHVHHGREAGAARERATVGVDGANARLVRRTRSLADAVVRLP